MGLFDVLRGQRAPKRANLDALFALTTAAPMLQAGMGYEPTNRAGVCFKPVEAAPFAELLHDLDQLLAVAGKDTGTKVTQSDDDYGFRWVVLEDPDFEDLVATAHLVNQTIEERGFSDKLLCSVFGFVNRSAGGDGAPVYFVYSYKRGTFYPFAPRGDQRRDTALELRLQGGLTHELPLEPELERWYPVWGVPVAPGPAA
jgi:PspAB-like protein